MMLLPRRWTILLSLLTFLLTSTVGFPTKYPKGLPCKVYNTTELDCANRKLSTIPPLVDDAIKHLDLSHNELKSINGIEEVHLRALQLLNMSNNQLKVINGTSFSHLTSLQILDLSHNMVKSISFNTSLPLKVLDLRSNKVLIINTNTFSGLNKLQILSLSSVFLTVLQLDGSPFHTMTSLKALSLSGYFDLSPTVLHGLYSLESFHMFGNYILTSFPDSVFQNLTKLTHLNVHGNFIKSLQDNLFVDFRSLESLDLSGNYLTDLPEAVFRNLISLKVLLLYHNEILCLPEMLLTNLNSLEHLDISYNQLSSLPAKIFVNLTSLVYLDLSGNILSDVPESLMVNLFNLEYLDLHGNSISSIPERLFANLANLEDLDISLNSLASIPCKAMGDLQKLIKLDMRWNNFEYLPCPITNMTSLKELHLSYPTNYVTTTEFWSETKWFELLTRLPASQPSLFLNIWSNSVLQTVAQSSFNSTLTLLEISYCNNSRLYISSVSIENDAFRFFPYLQKLRIQLDPFCDGVKRDIHLSRYAFRGLSHLWSLHLLNTGLTEFPSEALMPIASSLWSLHLSHNEINDLFFEGHLTQLQLQSLVVSNNPIRNVRLDSLGNETLFLLNLESSDEPEMLIFGLTFALQDIYISGSSSLLKGDYNVPLCTSPVHEVTFSRLVYVSQTFLWGNCSRVTSIAISDSTQNIFSNQESSHFPNLEYLKLTNCKLPWITQSLLQSRNLRFIDMSVNNIRNLNENDFSSLINLDHLDFSYNQIESLPTKHLHYMVKLTYLNLTSNKLTNLEGLNSLQSLQILIVSENELTTLHDFVLLMPYNVLYMDFGNNPFSCTCDIQPLQNWIQTDTKTNINPQLQYLCKYPATREHFGITAFTLDCSLHLEYIIPPTLIGLMVICIVAAVTYKYRWHIHYKFWVLFYQRRYQRYVDNDDDADIMNSDDEDDVDAREAPIMRRRYHGYVAYHRESEEWVNDQLVAVIEDGPEPFRLCLKERGDIPAGHYILNAICHGIYHSRKTIAVLSEHFMDDGWCHYQLQIAQMRLVKDNEDVLILVQIGEIPDHKKTLLLRQILRNKEVLKWPEDAIGQELFWNQLKMKLRKPFRFDRRFEEV